MKKNEIDIIKKAIKGKGIIKSFGPKKKRAKTKTNTIEYEIGGAFKLACSKPGVISGLTYTKPKSTKKITVPCFMGIKPTYYVQGNYLHIVFLLGNEPCDLHRVIFCVDYCDPKKPTFDFRIDPIFNNCRCDNQGSNVFYATSGGLGGGTWN